MPQNGETENAPAELLPVERNSLGRFIPGNKVARKRHSTLLERLREMASVETTEEDLRDILGGLLTGAKGGDVHCYAALVGKKGLEQGLLGGADASTPAVARILEALNRMMADATRGS
jgi:hypothetical protein